MFLCVFPHVVRPLPLTPFLTKLISLNQSYRENTSSHKPLIKMCSSERNWSGFTPRGKEAHVSHNCTHSHRRAKPSAALLWSSTLSVWWWGLTNKSSQRSQYTVPCWGGRGSLQLDVGTQYLWKMPFFNAMKDVTFKMSTKANVFTAGWEKESRVYSAGTSVEISEKKWERPGLPRPVPES